jgi:hypothetical protein
MAVAPGLAGWDEVQDLGSVTPAYAGALGKPHIEEKAEPADYEQAVTPSRPLTSTNATSTVS